MYRLNTLGGLQLADAGGTPVRVARARPMGLLVYLACAPEGRLIRRDRLLALFWPELDTDRARHSLRQAVYSLRQSLGPDAILSHGEEELGIDRDRVWCDARQLAAAATRKAPREVVELYQGEFLPGYHLRGAAAEFGEWVEEVRRELRHAATQAAWQLAAEAESRGDPFRAAQMARTAAAAAPADEVAQRRLMELLDRLGDHAGALAAHDAFAARLHAEFGLRPDAETEQLARRLTLRVEQPPPRPGPAPTGAISNAAPATLHGFPRFARAALAGGLAVLAMVTLLVGHRARALHPPVLAVGRIEESQNGDSTVPLAVLSDLLATNLARVPQLQVLSGPRLIELEEGTGTGSAPGLAQLRAARAGGATILVEGRERLTSGVHRLDLQLIDLPTGRIAGSLQVNAGDLFALADSATSSIANHFGAPRPAGGIASVTATSLAAYRLYTEGLRSYYRGDAAGADRLFVAALEEDSTFAMAAYYGFRAAFDHGAFGHADSLLRWAVTLAPSLSERERLLIEGAWANYRLDPVGRALADTFVSRFPTDPDAYLLLARSGQDDPEATLSAASQVLVLDPPGLVREGGQCRACEALEIIIWSNQSRDSFPAALRSAEEFVRYFPGLARSHRTLADVLERLDRFEAAAREQAMVDSLLGQPLGLDIPAAIRAGRTEAADQQLEHQLLSARVDQRIEAVWWLTISLRIQGRIAAARELQEHGVSPTGVRVAQPAGPDSVQLAQIWCESDRPEAGAALYHRIADQGRNNPDPYHGAKQESWHLAHAAACLALAGDTGRLGPLADTVESIGARSPWVRDQRLHHYVRGLALTARHDWPAAIEAYRRSMTWPVEGLLRVNYELAGALMQAGRPSEAIGILQSAHRGPLDGGGLYITRTEIEERLAQAFAALGQRDSSAAHYAWVEQAWRSADPGFRFRWRQARDYRVGH